VPARFPGILAVHEEQWTGNHLDFHVSVLKQPVRGTIEVAEHDVRLSVELPWVIAALAEKAKTLISRQGTLMLEKK